MMRMGMVLHERERMESAREEGREERAQGFSVPFVWLGQVAG